MPNQSLQTLNGRLQWLQELNSRLARAYSALKANDPVQLAAATRGLAEFRDYPGPYDDLRQIARDAIGDLLLHDFQRDLDHLAGLQKQLLTEISGEVQQERFVVAEPKPRHRLLHAFSALTTLREQHQQAPFQHSLLSSQDFDQQLSGLLNNIQSLLDQPPAPTVGKTPPAGKRQAKAKAKPLPNAKRDTP